MEVREARGKKASPTSGVIDSQSVKTTESGDVREFHAGENINGFLIGAVRCAVYVQDRDGAPLVLKSIRSASVHQSLRRLARLCNQTLSL